jgi:hypothetical protein
MVRFSNFTNRVHEHPPRLRLIGYYEDTDSDGGIARRGPSDWRGYQTGNLSLVMNRGLLNDRNDTMWVPAL